MTEFRFYNVWETSSREAQRELTNLMRHETKIFADQPGFLSLTGWRETHDNRIIVEARWTDRASFEAAVIDNPAAKAGRARMEAHGTSHSGVFEQAFIHLPRETAGLK